MNKLKIIAVFLFLLSANVAFASDALTEILIKEKNLDQNAARKTVDEVFETIKDVLARGESVQIRNFGTFYLQERAARKAINPKTKAILDVPARKYARFRVSDNFKKKLFENTSSKAVEVATQQAPAVLQ